MDLWAGIVSAAVVLYGLHRLARWAEERGWINYRDTNGRGAAMHVAALFQPDIEHVIEAEQQTEREVDVWLEEE